MPAGRAGSASSARGCSARRSCTSAATTRSSAFLPGILRGTEIWCQGYSEPNAGSDLANVQTRAVRDGDEWVVHGPEGVDVARALGAVDLRAVPHRPRRAEAQGPLVPAVPMDQPGIEIRPIVQITGHSEFNETFFDGARTAADNVVGEVNGGWRVAMGTLAFERGASTLGQQLSFENELRDDHRAARGRPASRSDPVVRQRLADAWITLRIMRYHALRTLPLMETGTITRRHVDPQAVLGELPPRARRARGRRARRARHRAGDDERSTSDRLQRLFLYSRADTIYGGSNEIQKNVIGEQALGLPREPR